MRLWLLATQMVMLVGCYQPGTEQACTVQCAAAGQACPSGLACSNGICALPGGGCGGDAAGDGAVDARRDGGTTSDVGQSCYGHSEGLLQLCVAQPPTIDQTLSAVNGYEYATGPGATMGCDVVSTPVGEICVIALRSLSIPSSTTLVGNGSRPLVFLVTEHLQVDGTISVAADNVQPIGPRAGAGVGECGIPTMPGSSSGAGGGGAGGWFGGGGANGGSGNSQGLAGGIAAGAPQLDQVRGGCAGQSGGGTAVPNAGAAGGAVYFIVGSMTVGPSGSIRASGGPGRGGPQGAGGGGGGSGGLIGIDVAGALTVNGIVFANGGAGGGGGSTTGAGASGSPSDGPTQRGFGGMGATGAGSGGHGSFGVTTNGTGGGSGLTGVSGGGGGGGAGYVLIYPSTAISPTTSIAPPPTSPPF